MLASGPTRTPACRIAPGPDERRREHLCALVQHCRGVDARRPRVSPETVGEQPAVCREVALRRADVAPVAGQGQRREAAADEQREDLALDRDRPSRGDQVEHGRLEHVCAGVHEVARRLARLGLLDEAQHRAVLLAFDDAVAARIVDLHERDRRRRRARAVQRDERAEVVLGEDVAVQQQERPGHAAPGREPCRPRRPERLGLDDVLEREPGRCRAPVAEVRDERVRQVAAGEDRALDAGRGELVEQVGEQRAVDERQHRLRRAQRERPQAGAGTADEDDGVHQSRSGRPTPSYR